MPNTRIALSLAALLLVGCQSTTEGVVAPQSLLETNYQHGTAYDVGFLSLAGRHTLVIPSRATLKYHEEADAIRVQMKKWLNSHCITDDPLTIEKVRAKLGCAWRSEAGRLMLATYGEFDSGIEGGIGIELTVTVPNGTNVLRDDRVERPRNANGASSSPLRRREEGGEVWYSLNGSDERWTIVEETPDLESAQEASSAPLR